MTRRNRKLARLVLTITALLASSPALAQAINLLPPATTPPSPSSTLVGVQGGAAVQFTVGDTAEAFNFTASSIPTTTIPSSVTSFRTAGYASTGDGGESTYVRSSGPSAPDKVQDAGGNWWQLIPESYGYNVRQFGATGNGTTDDGPSVQNALNIAAAAGQPLYVPPGTYSLQTRQTTYDGHQAFILVPTACNIRIFGAGYESVFTIPNNFSGTGTADDYSFFWSANATPHLNVEISGIHIDGNGANNLVIDSNPSGNLRRGYGFYLKSGTSFYIHDCFFNDFAGRNVLIVAASTNPAGWTVSRVVNNTFVDMGGAIAGNENQSDHSTIYTEALYSLVEGNVLRNTNASFNPFASPAHSVTAIEEHSARSVVIGNTVVNYGTGANGVAAAFDVYEQIWLGNQFLGMKSNVVQPIAEVGFKLHRFLFHSNSVEIDNTVYSGGAGVLQSTGATVTLGHISIRGNAFYCLNQAPASDSNAGIFICSADYLDIYGNEFAWWQGPGIELWHSGTMGLGIGGGVIDNNKLTNCGIGTVSTFYSIAVVQPDTDKLFANIVFGPLNTIVRTPQAVGTTPLVTKGIQISGGGNLQDIQVWSPRTIGLDRGNRVVFSTTTYNKNVVRLQARVELAVGVAPIRGQFSAAGESVVHSNPSAGNPFGRIVTTDGSAYEATWAANTAYTVGQWVLLPTSGDIIEYTVAGTSDPATEPTPSQLGQQYTDGTATFVYVDTVAAVLANYGAVPIEASKTWDPPSLSAGAVQSTTVTATGAALGDFVKVSMSVSLGGTILSGEVTSANTVTVYQQNPTGGSVDVASGTLTVSVTHP